MIGRKSTNLNTAYDFLFVIGGTVFKIQPGEVLQEFSDVFLLSFPTGSYIYFPCIASSRSEQFWHSFVREKSSLRMRSNLSIDVFVVGILVCDKAPPRNVILPATIGNCLLIFYSHSAVNACLVPLVSVHGVAVTTIEGIGNSQTRLHVLQVCLWLKFLLNM